MTSDTGSVRVLGERYVLRHRLGSGGAGAVWAAHDRALDRPVAVKLLHADLAEDPVAEARFRTEATAAAKLSHPSAVLIYDVGRDGDDDYLVMELVTGTSLAALLTTGPLQHEAAAAMGTAVASALGSAHRAGIVHRDVKPGNVLLTEEGHAKLADFGIARALGDLESRLTRTGTVLGTARYLAPEQLRDDPVDGRADVYSLGVVLHEALTGIAPFGEGTAVEVATRRLTTDLPAVTDLVPDVPPGLAEIVDWATQVDPRARPTDGEELARALQLFVAPGAERWLASRIARAGTVPGPAPPAPGAPEVRTPPAPTPDPPTPDPPTSDPPAPAATPPRDRTATLAAPAATRAPSPTPSGSHTETRSQRGATPPGPERDVVEGGGRSPVPAWVVVLVAAAAIVLGVVLLGPGADQPGDGAATGGAEEPVTLEIAEAGDHDPLGDGERPGDIPAAIDGDPETFWPTQTYNSADLGGLKEGVGMWAQLPESTDLERVDLTLSNAAGELELWVGDGPPQGDQLPAEWGQLVGEGTIGDTRVRFPLEDRDVRADTLLLWFTELPPAGDGFRAEVRTIEVVGR